MTQRSRKLQLRKALRWALIGAVAAMLAAPVVGVHVAAPVDAADWYPDLLINGSFEEPDTAGNIYTYGAIPGYPSYRGTEIPGWRILGGTIDVVPSSVWQAADGKQSIDLVGTPGAATIEQEIPTTPGQIYVLSGYVSHNPGVPYGRAMVYVDRQPWAQLFHSLPVSPGNMNWRTFSLEFFATRPVTSLAISDVTGINDWQGTALDALAVTVAPG